MSIVSDKSSFSYQNASGFPAGTSFPFPTLFFDNGDLQVILTSPSGVVNSLSLSAGDYSVSGAGVNSGGTVVIENAVPANFIVTIVRNVAISQATSYTTGDRFPASVIERSLDRLTMICQQLSRTITAKALRLIEGSSDQPAIIPAPNSVIAFDAAGKAYVIPTSGVSGNGPFVLAANTPGGAPVFQQQATSQIADSSVTNSKLAPQSVTKDKLAPGAIDGTLIPSSAITADKVASQAITADKLASGAATTDKIADGSITNPKIADLSVGTSKLAAQSVTGEKVADQSISISKLDNDANERLFESAPTEVACDGRVQGIAIINPGALYTTAPTITIARPSAGGIQATAIATLGTGSNAGKVVGITITNKGKGYKSDPAVTFSAAPTGGTTATAIAYAVTSGIEQGSSNAGGSQECISFIMKDGQIMSVGANNGYGYAGALGDIDFTVLPQPASIGVGYARFVRLWKAWHQIYALDTTGQLWSCGLGYCGSLGLNDIADRWQLCASTVPTPVAKFATSYGRDNNACLALLGDGRLFGWGYNAQGALGDNTLTNVINPKVISSPVSGIWTPESNIVDFALIGGDGSISTFLLRSDGTVRSAGRNDYGQLGHGTANAYEYNGFSYVLSGANTPLTSVKKIVGCGASTYGTAIFLRNDGTVYACGRGTNGQLGNGTTPANQNYAQPCLIAGVANIWATGGPGGSTGHVHALKTDGSLWAWGYNAAGPLGTGAVTPANVSTPVQVWPAANGIVVDVVQHGGADTGGTMILLADGRMFYTGNGAYGCRGDGGTGTTNGQWTQVQLNRRDIVDINFGSNQDAPVMTILTSTGEVYVAGINLRGTLGNGRTYDHRGMPGRVVF